MPQPHPTLYGFITKQTSKDTTTLCIYTPKRTITVQINEEYNLENYFKWYIVQHPTFTTYIKQKMISTLLPPRMPPINIPPPKVSDTVKQETYNFPPVLQSLAYNTSKVIQ